MSRYFSFRKWFDRLLERMVRPRRNVPPRKYFRLRLDELENRLAPAVTFSIATANVIEPGPGGTANMDFTITRSGDLNSQLTVGYTTVAGTAQPGADFTPTTGTATFAYGAATTTIGIPVFGPNAYNTPNLTFSVQLNGIVSVVGGPVSMAGKADFAVGTQPTAVAMGDLNGDGKLDLVVSNFGSNTVSVLLNTTAPGAATPTFATQQAFATGTQPSGMAIADLNRDGKPDLIVANANAAGTVSILLNTTAPGATTPSFATHADFGAGATPLFVATGDVNGDGKPDLVVANNGSDNVSVLLNTTAPGATSPTFGGHVDFGTGTKPYSVALGDLNGDGKPDIVVANGGANNVSVLPNTTAPGAITPSFAVKQDFTTGTKPTGLALADLSGDGRLDVVVTNATDNTVSVLLNTTATGAANFTMATKADFQTGAGPQSVALKDMNGDGKADLVVANGGSGANTVSVVLNTTLPGAAAPTFAGQQSFATGFGPIAVAVGDVNGDGKPDVATANSATGANAVSLLLSTTTMVEATNTSSFPATQLQFNNNTQSSAMADFNGDGKPDLAVNLGFGDYSVAVLLSTTAPGAAAPTFVPVKKVTTALAPEFVTAGDINSDGKPDLIDIIYKDNSNNSTAVYLNTTALGDSVPSFAIPKTFAAGGNERMAVLADINGDGRPDLIVDNYSGYASVLLNTTAPGAATASFANQQTFTAGNGPVYLAAVDINGDGLRDLVIANQNDSTVSVLLNTTAPGATTVSFAAQRTFACGTNPQGVAVGDFNGDGKPDLVVANVNSSARTLLNTTSPGAAIPTFSASTNITPAGGFTRAVVQDINGDGKPDVLLHNYFDGTELLLLNTTTPGATTLAFTNQSIALLGRGANAVTLGDLNGDGRPDIVVTTQGANAVPVLINTPASVTAASASATATIQETAQFSAASETVNENAGTFSVTVNLSLASPVDTTIPFTIGGTAVSGTNFSGVTTSPLVIPAGQTSATITGTLINDGKFTSPNKTITFTLGTPTNATLGSATANTLTIQESTPAPTVGFGSATQTVSESDTTFTATVTISSASSLPVTVPFTLSGTAVSGTNYSNVTVSPLTIAAGATSATISGTLIHDGKYDTVNKTLIITLGTPTNAALSTIPVDTLTIQQSDPLPTVSPASATQTVNENGGTFTVRVNLSAASNVATTIPFTVGGTAVSGTNYSGLSASPLAIPAGQTFVNITGTLIDDGKFDTANKTLIFTLGTPTNAALGATTASTLTINQSDPQPTVSFASATQTVSESAPALTVTVNLSVQSNAVTSVPFTLGGTATSGVNYTGIPVSPLVFAAGQTSATFTVAPIDDGKYDPVNKTLIITLGTPTNAILGAIPTDSVTIQESSPPPTVAFASATQTVSESGGAFHVAVNLSAASNVDTTIPFTLGGTAVAGTDYSGASASPLVIAAGQTSGTINGTLIDDGKFDIVNKTLTLTLGTPTNGSLGAITTSTLTIQESDPPPAVSFTTAAETVDATQGAFSLTVTLSAPSNVATIVPFTVTGTAAAGADYSGLTASPLSIPAGQTSATIAATLLTNPGPNPAKSLIVTLGPATNAILGSITTNTLTIIQPLHVGDQTLSYRQNTFTVNLPPEGTASFTIAGSRAFFLHRDLALTKPSGNHFYYYNYLNLGEVWFEGNPNSFGNPWYFVKHDGSLYAWDGTRGATGSTLLANLDPVYNAYPDLLANPTKDTLDYIVQQAFELESAGSFYQNYAGQNEKWVKGELNCFLNPWYFIDTQGNLYGWDGTPGQTSGMVLARLGPLYWAQPDRLLSAQPGEVTGAITGNTLTITTPANWSGRAVVELNTTAPRINQEIFTLNWVNHAPDLTITPSGNQTTPQGTTKTLTVTATDADGDAVTTSALAGNLGYVLQQSLGLHLASSLWLNYGGQQEKWLLGTGNAWYFIKPDGSLWKWDGTLHKATGTLVNNLDPVYYYHLELLVQPPAGDPAYALFKGLKLTGSGNFAQNYGGQNEKWLLGLDGWYFVKPDGTFWKWDGTLNKATGTLQATLNKDYYGNIKRLFDNPSPSQVTVRLTGNQLTLTPANPFLGDIWVLVKASDSSESTFKMFKLTVFTD